PASSEAAAAAPACATRRARLDGPGPKGPVDLRRLLRQLRVPCLLVGEVERLRLVHEREVLLREPKVLSDGHGAEVDRAEAGADQPADGEPDAREHAAHLAVPALEERDLEHRL